MTIVTTIRRCNRCREMRPHRNGARYCEPCREWRNGYRAGTCEMCHGPTTRESVTRCGPCYDKWLRNRRQQRKADREAAGLPVVEYVGRIKLCLDCGSMPWRVPGIVCKRCGLRYAREPVVRIDEFIERRNDRTVWPDAKGVG